MLFFCVEKARTETIEEISNQLNDIKESISQLESPNNQEEYLIDKSLLEMTKTLDYVNNNISEGKIDIAISAINFTDKIIKDISNSVIPKEIQTEVVDKKIEYSPEQLEEIIEITDGMQSSKKKNELKLVEDIVKIQNNGFSAFDIADNLKDNGINTLEIKDILDTAIVNKVAEPELLEQVINDASKLYELKQKESQLSNEILKSVSKEQAKELLNAINEGEEIENIASKIVSPKIGIDASSFSVSEILNDIDKTKGTEILKSTLDDIVDPKLVSIGKHRQYLKDWDIKVFSDGSTEIIATPQELEEAANISEVIQKESQLSNEILKSVSKEQAKELLNAINEGEEIENIASKIVEVTDSVAETTAEVTESVAETTAEVTESVAETTAEVTESVAETAAEVTESVAETAAEVTESVNVEELTEALQEIVGNSTGELTITRVGRHRGLNSAGELVDQVSIFRSDGSMEVCTETGDMNAVSSRGGC